jgi:hypothetical protein
MFKKHILSIFGFVVVCFSFALTNSFAQSKQLIFPIPSYEQVKDGWFTIDTSTEIIVAENKNKSNEFLARLFANELADKYSEVIKINNGSQLIKDKSILIGDVSDPLIKKYCDKNNLLATLRDLGNEGYILTVSNNNIVIAANTKQGAVWGLQSLRQVIHKEGDKILVPQMIVKDAPTYSFRGIKLYLPGKNNIEFFKRFIKDFVVLYKYNKIILELNANMRLDKHPELNIGAVEFAKHLNASRLDRPPGVHKEYQNSSHQDNADGGILEKEEVGDIVNYIRKFSIEVIPELPSLAHSYYLLSAHKELAENMAQPYPDTYCPLKPGSYKLYFDVLDEYIDVIHPATTHVGHDEWRVEKDLCELCKGKDYGVLYANDLKKIHDHLAAKGIKTAIWGDHLLESVTEKDHQTWKSSTGYTYKIPGALRPEQVLKLIPKDIIVFNWFWNDINNDNQLSNFGFKQVYGNLRPDISDWQQRQNIKGVIGGAPSSWAATTAYNIGKDQLYDFLADANLLWSKHILPQDELAFTTEPLISDIYKNFREATEPSEVGFHVTSINISSLFNDDLNNEVTGLVNATIKNGSVSTGNNTFNLSTVSQQSRGIIVNNDVKQSKPIPINKDVSSIVFLHACTNEAVNDKAYSMIYDFDDTAEPLGYYEILYEDGLVETVPIRYGVNILDWKWRQRIMNNEKEKRKYSQNKYAYQAAAVDCSAGTTKPITFFSFEWSNNRLGKKIKEVSLKSVDYKKGNENAIILLAVNTTESEKISNATGTESQ